MDVSVPITLLHTQRALDTRSVTCVLPCCRHVPPHGSWELPGVSGTACGPRFRELV